MIAIVLVQKSKGGGLSSSFGGGNQVLGVRGTNKFLEKTTWILAVLILVFSVCSAYFLPKSDASVRTGLADMEESATEAPAPTADQPAVPLATETPGQE